MENTYFDAYGNKAIIEAKFLLPYKEAKQKEKCFILSVYSLYDDGFMYHRSVYGTHTAAIMDLSKLSGGTFKEA